MAEKKDYINLSVEKLQEFIEQEFKDSLYSYPISMMEARAGIYLDVLDDGSLYLDTLNIRPDLQGKGVGSEILGILKEWAIANGKAVYIKPAYLSDNPFFKGVELSPEEQVDNLFNFYKKNGWEDNPNFTALSEQEQAAQLSLSANREWGVQTNDIYSPLVFIPEGVEVPELPKNPYLDNMISFAEKFNKEGKAFLDGYNEPILDEVLEEVLKLEMYFGVSGYMEESEWEKSKLHDVAIELDSQGIHPNDVADISEYIPRDKILTPAEIFKEGKRNEFFTDGIVKLLSEAGGSFYNLDENGDELLPENRPKRDYELYYAISGKDEAENIERVSAYKKKHDSVMGGPPKSLKWIEYSSKGDRPIPGIDTPTNVVDVGNVHDNPNYKVSLNVDNNGNVIIYRSTNTPDRFSDTDFSKFEINKTIGEQTYFASNPEFAQSFSQSGKRNIYSFSTNIKPEEILHLQSNINKNKELLNKLGGQEYINNIINERGINNYRFDSLDNIPKNLTWSELYYSTNKGRTNGSKEILQREIVKLQNSGIKAIGVSPVNGAKNEYNILPIINEQSQLDIVAKGLIDKNLKETPLDTPTNVVDSADEFPSLETRFKTETIDPDDYASPGDKYDLVTGWEDDVITPNKVFNPDQFTIINEQGLPVFTTQGKEMYQRILSGTATDEDITKFFIYLVTHSPAPAYTFAPFNKPDALADIIKIGIFGDRPLSKIIPLGSGLLEKQFFDKLLSRNKNIKPEEIVPIILDIVQENGQFENIKDKMRNVILNAHNDIYNKNPNDYFVLWRGGDLNRTFPWQSMTKRMEAAQDVASQMNGMYGSGIETSSYVLHKNNFIDLDALGLSYMNEQEIIVFTKAALAKGAKRPTAVNNPGKAKDITEWWLLAKESKDMFPKNGVDMTNISQYVDDSGQATQQFFSDVINGIDPRYRPSRPYESIIEITNEQLLAFQKEYNNFVKNGGNFNQHIFTSIPTFYEAQIVKGQALINFINNNYPTKLFSIEQNIRDELFDFKLLDIGGTEGSWASAVAGIEPRIQVTVLDPNRDAERIFNKKPLVNKKFQLAAFSHKKEDLGKYFDETAVSFIKPNRQYDIVHESMALQFIDGDRTGQIEFIKNEVLKENGILFIEEKFLDNDTIYQANENLKNEFKLQYYTEEQLQNKKFNVLLNMEGKQAAISDVEATLNKNFKHVVQYWDSGNFKGFVASDNEKVLGFVDEINSLNTSLTNHRFSTAPTDKEVKYSIQKKMAQNGTDSQLAAQIAEETMSNNPKFFNAISKQVGKLTGAGLGLLAKVTPVLAPGDVIIERALDKVVPYLDDAAAKLGFGRLKFGQIIPAYAAYEIGVALADTVQAALYAYDTSQQQAPREAGKFQQGLTKLLLPKAYEEQALKKSRLPGDLKAFYNTPTGKAVLEELDFGSQFMKELEAEKISKYSPGWGLTKSIFSLIGSAYEGSKNPSDYSTKLKDNPAMIYNAGFTGNNR